MLRNPRDRLLPPGVRSGPDPRILRKNRPRCWAIRMGSKARTTGHRTPAPGPAGSRRASQGQLL